MTQAPEAEYREWVEYEFVHTFVHTLEDKENFCNKLPSEPVEKTESYPQDVEITRVFNGRW